MRPGIGSRQLLHLLVHRSCSSWRPVTCSFCTSTHQSWHHVGASHHRSWHHTNSFPAVNSTLSSHLWPHIREIEGLSRKHLAHTYVTEPSSLQAVLNCDSSKDVMESFQPLLSAPSEVLPGYLADVVKHLMEVCTQGFSQHLAFCLFAVFFG